MLKKILVSTFVFGLFSMLTPKVSFASQGIFELRNQVGEDARCHVTSGVMEDQIYNILTICQDILYPGGTEVYHYVTWATPIDGGNAVRLGELGLGRKLFKTNQAFSNIFVTKELQANPRSPSGQVVMRGNLTPITFLGNGQPTIAPSDTESELGEASPSPSPVTRVASTGRNIFRIIAAGGIVAFLGLFGVILIIFVISRR